MEVVSYLRVKNYKTELKNNFVANKFPFKIWVLHDRFHYIIILIKVKQKNVKN
jgi:hypothetical protein